jgi:hypothetical protein
MKKIVLLSILFLGSRNSIDAQTPQDATLDINQVRASAQSTGDLFWTRPYNFSQFHVPADSVTSTIFAGALWIGGLDSGGGIHLAAPTYSQSGGDFFQGPVQDSQYYTMQSNAIWNHVWKINRSSIDSLILWQTNPANYPLYTMPYDIVSWPANGDVSKGQAAQLAPFVDSNGDGVYDPLNGDYPCIKGDQCIYFIFNDDRAAHTGSGGAKMKIEVHAMMYAYVDPGSSIDSTVFLNYKIYNRSSNTYTNTYCGQWTDFDIGDYSDDYVGSSVERGMYYGYNGDSLDGFGSNSPYAYGLHPPAQGVVLLRGPIADSNDLIDNDRDGVIDIPGETCSMWQFMAYNNDFTNTGNPSTAADYYNYLRAYWKDSTPATHGGNGYGGTTPYTMMYPGDSDPFSMCGNWVPLPTWDETNSGNVPNDRRGIGSSGAFTFEAGSSECITYAYVYARGTGNHLSSIDALFAATDTARLFFSQNDPCSCGNTAVGVAEHSLQNVILYPNPATDNITIICGDNASGSQIEVIDATGRLVLSPYVISGNSVVVDVSSLPEGIYFVRVNKGSVVLTGKFIRN